MRILFSVLAGIMLSVAIGCEKDDNTQSDCMRLEGNWTGFSWVEDGTQLFGDSVLIATSSITFGEIDGDTGSVDWNTNYIIVADERIIGTYRVNDQCDKVTLTPTGSGSVTYDYRFDGNVLVLERSTGGIQTTVRFSKT